MLVVQANLIEASSRWALEAAADEERRARATDWIVGIAANAVTVADFDGWLSAAGATRRSRAATS